MSNKVYIATSLDGYITDRNNNLDWLDIIPMESQNEDDFNNFMESIDAIVMGKNTFEKVLSFDQWVYKKKVFVLSNSLTLIPKGYENKIEFIKGKASEIIKNLKAKGYKNLYIDGGKTIQSFLDENLIDEMTITTLPILLGGGIPLFKDTKNPIEFKLINTKIISDIALQSFYKKK
jgi:dihydrofolate reductase